MPYIWTSISISPTKKHLTGTQDRNLRKSNRKGLTSDSSDPSLLHQPFQISRFELPLAVMSHVEESNHIRYLIVWTDGLNLRCRLLDMVLKYVRSGVTLLCLWTHTACFNRGECGAKGKNVPICFIDLQPSHHCVTKIRKFPHLNYYLNVGWL